MPDRNRTNSKLVLMKENLETTNFFFIHYRLGLFSRMIESRANPGRQLEGCIEQDFKNAKPLQKELIKTLLIKSMDFCPSTEVVPDWK